MRARGNTAAFTIESSYRARLDWDRIPQDASLFRRSGFEGGRSARNARVRVPTTGHQSDCYSITSSAWASSVGGTVRPSAFAVFGAKPSGCLRELLGERCA